MTTTAITEDASRASSCTGQSRCSAIFGDSLAVLNGLLAPIPEDRKRRLAALARECIINSGGDPDAPPTAQHHAEAGRPIA